MKRVQRNWSKGFSFCLSGVSVCLAVNVAQGAEVDNFTAKKMNLPDRARELNDLANRYLDNVIVAVNNANAGCDDEVLFSGLKQVYANHSPNMLMKSDDILGAQYNRGPYVQCDGNRWVVNKNKPIDFRDYVDESFNVEIVKSLAEKYSPHGLYKYILNSRGIAP